MKSRGRAVSFFVGKLTERIAYVSPTERVIPFWDGFNINKI